MASATNLKVNIGADTAQFEKGIRQVRSDLKAFGSVSDDVLGKLGQALGVDLGQVEKMSGAIRGMGRQMQESGSEGEAAFGKLLSSVNKLSVGLGALGIAGVVASFKALNAEAEAFKNTVAGANIEMQTAAYIQTYQQVFHDFNTETGKSVAEWEAKWEKGFARFKANAQQNFVSVLTGNGNFFQSAFPLLGTLVGGNRGQRDAATAAAESAEQIAGNIYQLERQRKDQSVEIARLNAEIADWMGVAKDASVSIADRQRAIQEVEARLELKREKTVNLEQQLAALYQRRSDLAADDVSAADALLAQQQRVFDTDRSITQEENSLLRIKNSLTSASRANREELQKQLALQQQIAQSRRDLAALDLSVSGTPVAGATTQAGGIVPRIDTTAFQKQLNLALGDHNYIEIGVQIDKGSLIDLTNQVSSVMANLADSLSASIGGLIGDLLTGGDAWSNFTNAALSAFGDMATSVGRIAIECGVAALGIKAALESLGPAGAVAAIAAGTALVALGAAVKAGLSNVASGNYSATASVASGSYSGGGDYETRDVNIHVTGQFRAEGDALVAVLDETSNRNGYTT